jgi:hypothetical protein
MFKNTLLGHRANRTTEAQLKIAWDYMIVISINGMMRRAMNNRASFVNFRKINNFFFNIYLIHKTGVCERVLTCVFMRVCH